LSSPTVIRRCRHDRDGCDFDEAFG
jgi:hypothetical protein